MRQQITSDLAAKAAAQKEAEIIAALPKAFAMAEVIDRCDVVVTPDKVETYRLDGVPFLEFHPPEIKSTSGPDGFRMIVTQKYRVLRRAAA